MDAGRLGRGWNIAATTGATLATAVSLATLVLLLNEPPPMPGVVLRPPPVVQASPGLAPDAPAPGLQLRSGHGLRPSGLPPAEMQQPAVLPAPAVQPEDLSRVRPGAAKAFLDEVQVRPHPRGGFIVQAVLAESRWAHMGLRPGDLLFTIDTPRMAAIDERSMVALVQQTELELDIYRDGQPTRLTLALHRDEADDDDARRDRPPASSRP